MPQRTAQIFAAEIEGIHARLVEVEVDLNVGLHAFTIVGLADKAIGEARERVNSALKNAGVKPPNRENRRITINLAPADTKKTGSHYDVAMAIGYLVATGQIKKFETRDKIFLGELALDGRLRPVAGALNVAEVAASKNIRYIFLPEKNAEEAGVIRNIAVIPIATLGELINHLEERVRRPAHIFLNKPHAYREAPDLSEIHGQRYAKRALIIAAAGGHNLLMTGPPGVGKSFLAQALSGILPPLDLEESIEVTKIWSAAGLTARGLVKDRPFRSPHQAASDVSIIGGGGEARPGEISLAHHGILFLDELPEFRRSVLEALRAPLENGMVHIARARRTITLPARFTLVATMNPCPCGYFDDEEQKCRCSAYEVLRYRKRLSGPLLDRIDMQIQVPRISLHELRHNEPRASESSQARLVVEKTREIQRDRSTREVLAANADRHDDLDPSAENFLTTLSKTSLSPRGYHRLIKTSRTIADLEGKAHITAMHLAEAFGYRIREESLEKF